MANDTQVTREVLFSSVVSAALEYYKSFLTVATTFLIGSLYLLKDGFVLSVTSFWTLTIGSILLVLSIGLILEIQRQNISSGNKAVCGDFTGASAIDRKKSCLGYIAIWTCVIGMLFVVLAGVLGFKGGIMLSEKKPGNQTDGLEKKGSIDFGSTGPIPKPQIKPTEAPKPNPTPKPKPKDKE